MAVPWQEFYSVTSALPTCAHISAQFQLNCRIQKLEFIGNSNRIGYFVINTKRPFEIRLASMVSRRKRKGSKSEEQKKDIPIVPTSSAIVKAEKNETKLSKVSTALLGIDDVKLKQLNSGSGKKFRKNKLATIETPGSNSIRQLSVPGWTSKDLLELVLRIQAKVPSEDKVDFKKQVSLLEWNEIKFDNHSAEDCKEAWSVIENKIRRFRILKEVVRDVRDFVIGGKETRETGEGNAEKKKKRKKRKKTPLADQKEEAQKDETQKDEAQKDVMEISD